MQAARGTSVTADAAGDGRLPSSRRARKDGARGRDRLVYLLVVVLCVGTDALTKQLAVTHLEPGVAVPVVGRVLQLLLIRNSGAAFSLGESFTLVFTVLAFAVLVFVVTRLVPRLGHRGWAVALGLLTAGVAGNLIDRVVREPAVLRGHVVDFLQLPHWPIFNVADSCITAAAVFILVLAIGQNVGIDGRRYPRANRSSDGVPAVAGSEQRVPGEISAEESGRPDGAAEVTGRDGAVGADTEEDTGRGRTDGRTA